MPPAHADDRKSLGRVAIALTLAFLSFLGVTKVWLAGQESLIWMDEVYSLGIASTPTDQLLDRAASDSHPPLYYLALRAFLRIADSVQFDRTILWARSIGVLAWLALLGVTGLALRNRLNSTALALTLLLVGTSPGIFQLTHDARSYCLAILGITGAYIGAAFDLSRKHDSGTLLARHWLLYSASAALATWAHNLSWVALAATMLAWAILSTRHRILSPKRVLASLCANCLVVLVSLPALLNVPHQIHTLTAGTPTWMTPASVGNLARVFGIWIPLGRDAESIIAAFPISWFIVAACWLSAAWVGREIFRRNNRELEDVLAELGLSTAILFVILIWSAARWFGVPVFHGPRYPLLLSGVWALALSGHYFSSARKGSRAPKLLLLASPWITGGLIAIAVMALPPLRGESALLSELRTRERTAESVYFIPEQLGSFFHGTLEAVASRSLISLCNDSPTAGGVLLNLNHWREVDDSPTLLIHTAIQQGLLGAFTRQRLPAATGDFELLAFDERDWQSRFKNSVCPGLEKLKRDGGLLPVEIDADLTRQLQRDGWSYLEFDRALRPFRWTGQSTALLRFPAPLPAGAYELLIEGKSSRGSEAPVEISVFASSRTIPASRRRFTEAVLFTIPEGQPQPVVVRLRSATSSVSTRTYSRELGVCIFRAILQSPGPAEELER